MPDIFWFRKDLRITDNRGLYEFVKNVSKENNYSFLYIKNKNTFNYFGEKRISFLIECLNELKEELSSFGFALQVIQGNSKDIFQRIVDKNKTVSVFCNEQVEPYCIARDNAVRQIIENSGGTFQIFRDTTIFALGEIKNGDGEQYRIFTPFRNRSLNKLNENHYQKFDFNLSSLEKNRELILEDIFDFNTENKYSKSDFPKGGRRAGMLLLDAFYKSGLEHYKTNRDCPAANGTSFLSAHLHFGTVNIRECLRTAYLKLKKTRSENKRVEVHTWISELLWREFYYNIAYHNPRIAYESFRKEFDNIKWNYDTDGFAKWCGGKTGFPIVDAGMRQLNNEGWMHNRLRMITAMFLTKDLLIDWRYGEKYFADKLIDMDFSNNNGGWQWSASTGNDAQPYFRIFNPYLQSRKFDKEGNYIRKYLPELRSLPAEFIHEPNLMNEKEQRAYGVIIGKDYPAPIVDHKKAKEETIRKFKSILNYDGNDKMMAVIF